MAKRNIRSRQQAAQRALTRLLLAQVAEMISRPGPLAAALQARFAQTTVNPDEVVRAFAGNGLSAARTQGLPARVVYCAMKLVAAERDWLLSLQAGGAISESQLERLAVLQGLLCRPEEGLLTPGARIAEQKPLERARPQYRVRADVPGKGESSS